MPPIKDDGVRRRPGWPRQVTTDADWERLLLAISARGSFNRALKLPEMPNHSAFSRRQKADPVFAARAEDARVSGLERLGLRDRTRNRAYDWAGGLAMIRAGKRLRDFLGTGDFPSVATWSVRKRHDFAFKAAVNSAFSESLEYKLREHPKTTVPEEKLAPILEGLKSGLTLTTVLAKPGMPNASTILDWRRKDAAVDARLLKVWTRGKPGFGYKYAAAEFELALEAITAGTRIGRLHAFMGLPSGGAIRARGRRDASFARRLNLAFASRGNIGDLSFNLLTHLSKNDIWSAANDAVSRGLPPFIRDDVISEILADVFEGYLEVRDIRAAAKEYVAEYFKSGVTSDRSFDARVFEYGGVTLHERL